MIKLCVTLLNDFIWIYFLWFHINVILITQELFTHSDLPTPASPITRMRARLNFKLACCRWQRHENFPSLSLSNQIIKKLMQKKNADYPTADIQGKKPCAAVAKMASAVAPMLRLRRLCTCCGCCAASYFVPSLSFTFTLAPFSSSFKDALSLWLSFLFLIFVFIM